MPTQRAIDALLEHRKNRDLCDLTCLDGLK